MQRHTMVLITINVLRFSGGSSAHHQKLKTLYTSLGIFGHFLLLTTIVSELELLDKYSMLCIQFWAPDDGRWNRLKHVEHL